MTFYLLRKKHLLAQWMLAEHSGLSRGTISRFERGKGTPSPATIRKLADALHEAPETVLLAIEASRDAPHGADESKHHIGSMADSPVATESSLSIASMRMVERVAIEKFIEMETECPKWWTFYALTVYRESYLSRIPEMATNQFLCQMLIERLVVRQIVIVRQQQNPRNPQHPTAALELNRTHPEVVAVIAKGDPRRRA